MKTFTREQLDNTEAILTEDIRDRTISIAKVYNNYVVFMKDGIHLQTSEEYTELDNALDLYNETKQWLLSKPTLS